MRTHALDLRVGASYMCTHTQACVRMLRFQKPERKGFLHQNLVWNESHIFWELPQTPIFDYIKPEKVDFQGGQILVVKHIRFTRK